MSVTSQLTDFADLVEDLQNRVRVQTGITATSNVAKRYINIALQDMHVGFGEKFTWTERNAILVTQPEYTTGTVTITKGSTALTGASTTWDTNNSFSVKNMRAGGKIVINGGVEIYTISSVTDDTNAVLTSAFVQADVAAVNYSYFEDEYALDSDFLRPFDIQFFDRNTNIKLIGRREFRQLYPRNKIPGKPLVASIVDKEFSGSTTPVRKVTFWKPPDQEYMIPYNFITNKLAVSSAGTAQTSLSADADEPIIPLQYRHIIVFHALQHWYRDKKDDQRSGEAKAEYTDLLLRITGDHEIGQSRPVIQPKLGAYRRAAQRPFSRGGGRYTTGSSFDEIRS